MNAPVTHGDLLPKVSPAEVREELAARREIVLVDLREEAPFAEGHPLWAANFPLGRLELEVYRRIPRRDTRIVLYGEEDGRSLGGPAAQRLRELGYDNVQLLDGDLDGWRASGGEIFIDVNVPSKAFGELVEARRHTPLWDAAVVKELIDRGENIVVLDARRFDEYQTMSIPTAISVPGAELVLRVGELAPDPQTTVIVNCAGRTRSIIGTQSLINAGIPNKVAGLRNGTIGWTLSGQVLDHGAARQFPQVSDAVREAAHSRAVAVAEKAGVRRISFDEVAALEPGRTLYRFDVRTHEEYVQGHLPGFIHAPGGQLVQETDHYAPVRGARIVLSDDDGVRAAMSASWLAQMGWDVFIVEPSEGRPVELGEGRQVLPDFPKVESVRAFHLSQWLGLGRTVAVLDVTKSANYVRGHIPGAHFVLRQQLAAAIAILPEPEQFVVTCQSGTLAKFAAADLGALTERPVKVLEGGTAAWIAAGLSVETGETSLLSPRIDRYRRPYEGTDAPVAAMEAYLEWEYGLVSQLDRDGTHNFNVLEG